MKVWIGVIVTLFAYPIVLRFAAWFKVPGARSNISHHQNRKPATIMDVFWFLLRILLNGTWAF